MKNNPKLVVLIGVIFVSFSPIFVKLSNAPSIIVATYRMIITVLIMAPSFAMKNTTEVKKTDFKIILLAMLSGFFLALHFATWMASINYTSIASSTILVNLNPLIVTVLSYFILKEKPTRKILLAIFLTFIGSIIIAMGDSSLGSNVLYGDILAILGALFASGYMVIGRIVRQHLSATSYNFITYSFSSIFLLIIVFINSTPLYPYPLNEWLIFFSLALFSTILGHNLFNWALKYINPTYVSTSILGEPVFATVWALFIFKEVPEIWKIIGCLLIVYGIYKLSKIEVLDEKTLIDLQEV